MSDSSNPTVTVILCVLTISTRPVDELELELALVEESPLESPRLPLLAAPVELLVESDDEPVEEESLPAVLGPETASPGETSCTLTTVPEAGAYSLVSASAVSAVFSVASALSTWAWAEATSLASVSGSEVVVCEEPPLPVPAAVAVPAPVPVAEPLPVESSAALPDRSPPVSDGVVVGAVTVTVVVAGLVVVEWLGVVVECVGVVVD
jgi:hypothetical protein